MKEEKKRFLYSLIFPVFFVLVIWIIKISEILLDLNLAFLGIFPLRLKGLTGILTAPLIHSDFGHLIANSIPILVLGTGLFYFYNKIAYKVFFLSYFIANIWIWLGARQAYHIGASGLVYSFAAFLFVSGLIRRNVKLMAISLLVVFLYGSMIWGVLPIQPYISWESHLLGAIAGIILAIYYKDKGPARRIYTWEIEEDEEINDEEKYWEIDAESNKGDNEK
ncbi:MAG: rhomboid family intramembrane serine protease [Bacteroidales bacterium]|jgi:membrane associated rhomboid family serine protease|nr:rhomboid family intramembrane serine protease [Bacteroidales bacterium]